MREMKINRFFAGYRPFQFRIFHSRHIGTNNMAYIYINCNQSKAKSFEALAAFECRDNESESQRAGIFQFPLLQLYSAAAKYSRSQ